MRSQEVKAAIINQYVNNRRSVTDLSTEYNVSTATIYVWLAPYTKHNVKSRVLDEVTIDKLCTEYRAGSSVKQLSEKYNVGQSTIYNYVSKHKQEAHDQVYSKDFKRNVISSLQAGRSLIEVSSAYNVSIDLIRAWVDQYRDGKLDVARNAIITATQGVKAPTPEVKSPIKEATKEATSDIDAFCSVFKLLAKKGLSVDDACEVAKELAPKLK
jgi:transposase-like protein